MYKITSILLLNIALICALESTTLPAEVLERIFGPAAVRNTDSKNGPIVGDIRMRREADAGTGGKCTFASLEGTCVTYYYCNSELLPATAELEQYEVIAESIRACEQATEECCPEKAIYRIKTQN